MNLTVNNNENFQGSTEEQCLENDVLLFDDKRAASSWLAETRSSSTFMSIDKLPSLKEIAYQLEHSLPVRNNRYHLRVYKETFVGSECVDYLVRSKFASGRPEAVELGRRIASELNLFEHVTLDHELKDGFYFYRFTNRTERSESNPLTDSLNLSERTLSMQEIARKLLRGIHVKDRKYKLRTYRMCFVGCEMVDFMVQARIVSSREEAVELGTQLMAEMRLFEHVTRGHAFADEFLFYRFSTSDETESSMSDVCDDTGDCEEISWRSLSAEELAEVGEQLRRGVSIKHRQYRLKTYKNCFVASHAVDYLVHSGLAQSRGHAVEIVRRLAAELDFVHHVTNDHVFEDSYLFFRFRAVGPRSTADEGVANRSSLSNSLSGGNEMEPPIGSPRLQIQWNSSLRKSEQKRIHSLRQAPSDGQKIAFIGGPAGSGKSSLVINMFSDDPTVIFAHAIFDQSLHSAPLQVLGLLFTDVCRKICVSSEFSQYLHHLNDEFNERDPQKVALSSWIPETKSLFPDMPLDCPSLERRSRNLNILQLAIHSFLKAVSAVKPLILFLDDIMWCDERSFNLLLHALTRDDVSNILWCAAYRHEEFDYNHPYTRWRRCIEDEHVNVDKISLNDLDLQDVKAFLHGCMKLDDEFLQEFAELMLERTHGNIFFLVQTLESLQDLSLLCYDFASFGWKFSVEDIRRKTHVADNVGDLLSEKIGQLPRDVQQVLKLASCFGASFDISTLNQAKSILYIFDDIDQCLNHAIQEKLIIQIADDRYRFAHDNVKDTAYNLLPQKEERQRIHWDIGLKLASKRPEIDEANSEWFFAVSDQMKLAGDIMRHELQVNHRKRIAGILHTAGESAARLSAFGPASEYFKIGISFGGGHAKAVYGLCEKLATNIFLAYAKVLISLGNIEESRRIAQGILLESPNEIDKRHASLLIYQCSIVENNLEEQIEVGRQLLDGLGVKVPKHPNFVQVSIEYDRAMKLLKTHTDDEIMGLAPMSDSTIEMSIDVLCSMLQAGSAMGLKSFVDLLLAKLINLTLQHGLCKYTPLIFVLVGRDRIAGHSTLKEGHKFVRLGLRLQQVIPHAAEVKGALLTESCIAIGCVEPLSKAMYHGLDAYKASMADGDTNNAFYGVSVYLWSFFYSGLPFLPLMDDVEMFTMQMLEYKHTRWFFNTIPILQLLLCLSGQEDDNHDITIGKAVQMNDMAEKKNLEGSAAEILQFYGLQLAVYMNDQEKALNYYEQLKDIDIGLGKATSAYHVRLFFFALVCMQAYRQHHKGRFKIEAKKYIATIRELVDGGAINLPHKLFLLDAEMASLSGKDAQDILRKYEKSTFAASRAGFLQDGSLSNFLCAQYCFRLGDASSAGAYLVQAHSQYCSWGAFGVAACIKQKHGNLFPAADDDRQSFSGSGYHSRPQFQQRFSKMHKSLSRARGIVLDNDV